MKKNDCLETPKYIIDSLGPFDMDPCASINTKHAKINLFYPKDDGLSSTWDGFVWCNPPFSEKELWIKNRIEHDNGILLLPERGSAPWFGPLAKHCGCYFVMGKKINFIGGSSSNNIGSCLFPFGLKALARIYESNLPGHFVKVTYFRPR
ncbi:MAG TPA: DNA N-6-adenine-methyltransferase [Methanosarcina sp.]|nr:DNA N-6-adenine-methyltransferase [Methanosarcina sp.]